MEAAPAGDVPGNLGQEAAFVQLHQPDCSVGRNLRARLCRFVGLDLPPIKLCHISMLHGSVT